MDFSRCPLQGTLPSELGLLTQLGKCFGNQLAITLAYSHFCLMVADDLQLSNSDMGGTIPSEIGHLTSMSETAHILSACIHDVIVRG